MEQKKYHIPYADLDDGCILIVNGDKKELLTVRSLSASIINVFFELDISEGVHPIPFNDSTVQYLEILKKGLDEDVILIDESDYKKIDTSYNLQFDSNHSLSFT